jgi:hypothetical protein
MVADGVAERVHDASVFTSEVGRWRLKVEKQPTMKELRERAAAVVSKVAAGGKEEGGTRAASPASATPAADGGEQVKGKRKVRFRF